MTEKEVIKKISEHCSNTKCTDCKHHKVFSCDKYLLGKQIERENMSLFEKNLEMLKLLEQGIRLKYKSFKNGVYITKKHDIDMRRLQEEELEIYN